jgi:hypothetical protein
MTQKFTFKPKWTEWIKCNLYVAFDCATKPKVADMLISGFRQIGFILSHEYELKPFVEETQRMECSKDGCERAILYKFNVRIDIYDKFGIGFGLGSGTGTIGWISQPYSDVHTFTTECVCCDDDLPPVIPSEEELVRQLMSRLGHEEASKLPVVAASAVVGTALAFAIVYSGYWLSQVFLVSAGLATLLSGGIAAWRISKSQSGRNTRSQSAPPLAV